MELSQRKEQYSSAFLRAVTSVAGYTLAKPDVDDDSIDWIIASRGGVASLFRRPRLEVQLKCSARDLMRGEHLHFPLSLKNYDDLRDEHVLVPRILIIMTVPDETNDWLIQSDDSITVRHCGYWMSLYGLPATKNTDTVTVRVPREQVFTPAALGDIMRRVNAKELP